LHSSYWLTYPTTSLFNCHSYVNDCFRSAFDISQAILAAFTAGLTVTSTYILGGRKRYTQSWHNFQPGQGGLRFVVLQAFGWAFFGLFLTLPAIPFAIAYLFPGYTIRGLAICAGAAALLSEISVVASLLLYKPTAQDSLAPIHSRGLTRFIVSETGKGWWKSFIGLQTVLALVGMGLSVAADTFQKASLSYIFVAGFAIACLSVAGFLTYGVGGSWKYYHDQWRFYQVCTASIIRPHLTLPPARYRWLSVCPYASAFMGLRIHVPGCFSYSLVQCSTSLVVWGC